jgi:hypothetical protein
MVFNLDTVHETAVEQFRVPLANEYFTATKGNVALFDHGYTRKILWKVDLAGDPYRLEEARGFF